MQLHGIQVRPSKKGHRIARPAHHAKMKFFGPHAAPRASSADERHAELTEQTQKWVAQTFYGQMLKQMRDSPFKSKLFDGGHGGEAFQQMADQHLADSMARGTGHKLVDAIVDRIEHPSTAGPSPVPSMKPAVNAAALVNRVAPVAAAGHDWGHA